ncbi:STAS domain-containing protein [Mycobacterium sp.]|uniref:STAS domain-containing protein n=1 Tax=Mycobacterium sp. TaxID=1785 RepID=UPI003D0EB113
MSVAQQPTTSQGDVAFHYGDLTTERDGIEMRAYSCHLATVVAISGDVDATNVARFTAHITHLVPLGNALLVDLSGVSFFAVRSMSALLAVDGACQRVRTPWALVTSHAVKRVLRLSECSYILPTVSTVPAAMDYFTHLTRMRRQVP